MDLDDLRRNWDAFGEKDPMWAILTGLDKSDGRWAADEFFRTGQIQAAEFVARLDELGLPYEGRMLDFGCGIGRLTQAFADYFAACAGVDIAASMITRARELNRHGDRVEYVLNERDDLSVFDDQSFDLVFSYIVLQHMEPHIATRYLREFFRIAKVGATLVFQMPTHLDPQPLPDDAFRAELTLTAPAEMAPGSVAEVEVSVRNASPVTWRAGVDPGVNFGNHWRRRRGLRRPFVAFDDARAALLDDVAPGEVHTRTLTVRAPDEPGKYLLEVDMVQELVAWFATRGSATAIAPVRVRAAGPAPVPGPDGGAADGSGPGGGSDDFEPVMEVYGIERAEVEALVGELGGTVVAADRKPDARPWESFQYYVTKTRHIGEPDAAGA